MTIFLRRMRAHDVIEGKEPGPWGNDDYAVVEGTLIGRIYADRVPGGEMKWRWFLQSGPVVPPPNSGEADTLEKAKAALAVRHRQLGGSKR
jgi:hypothetical protein